VVLRVVRVASIPFGLSALIDEQPGSLVVWLLASAWSKERARRLEEALNASGVGRGRDETFTHPDLHKV
jgi:hypothetical protein